MNEQGTLYIVATPIGNIGDISRRAIDVLQNVDIVYSEDTRNTKKLLQLVDASQANIETYNEHSSESVALSIYKKIQEGKDVAYVSDAGTPAISDPGARLIEKLQLIAKRQGTVEIVVSPIPGPSAVIAALSVSGFSGTAFTFLGFPPHKKGRKSFFEELASIKHIAVIFESSHRILKAIEEIHATCNPEREILICRELTKAFETLYRCKVKELPEKNILPKGEFVIVLNKND